MKYGVIFDMDGVIIDSEPIHIACEKEMFRRFGLVVSDDEHHTFVGTSDETLWSYMERRYGLPVQMDEAIRLTQVLYREYLEKTPIAPISGITELIAKLAENHFALALASSSPHDQIHHVLESFGIRPYFQATVSGEEVEAGKPDPAIFLKAAQRVGVDPGHCLVIEDSYNGVTAAKNAGMTCIGFRNPNSGDHDLTRADKIVHSFREVSPGVIANLLQSRK